MKQYLKLLKNVRDTGHVKKDRTGTGTLSVFDRNMRFDMASGFPLLTTKRIHIRSMVHELLWFLSGDTNIKYLNDNKVRIWDEWALKEDETIGYTMDNGERVRYANHHKLYPGTQAELITHLNSLRDDDLGHAYLDSLGVPRDITNVVKHKGDLGPVYGHQWRRWRGLDGIAHDQIKTAMKQLQEDPDNRGIIVSAWNVSDLDKMALRPCHTMFQFYTRELDADELVEQAELVLGRDVWIDQLETVGCENEDNEVLAAALDHFNFDKELSAKVPRRAISCKLFQRSADLFLGVPFNVASYSLLLHMFAQQLNMVPGEFAWTGTDVHVYSNHLEQVDLQLTREPKPLPRLVIKHKPDSIFDYKFEDFEFEGYNPDDNIPATVAI